MAQPGHYKLIHTLLIWHWVIMATARLVSTCSPAPSCTSSSTYVQNVHLDGLTVSPWRCWRLNSSAGWSWISFWDLQGSAAALEQAAVSHRSQVSQQIWAIVAWLLHITVVYREGLVLGLIKLLVIYCMQNFSNPNSRYFVTLSVISRLGKILFTCLYY